MPIQTDFGRFNTLSLPPDSTGKALALQRVIVISYTGIAGGTFDVGDTISGNTSSFSGRITTSVDQGGGTGQITALAARGLVGAVTTVDVAETITAGNGATATVEDVGPVYINSTLVSSGDNPFNTARVFPSGGLQVRFEEGDQQLSAFGVSKVQEDSQIAFYSHPYDIDADQWYDNVSGAGSAIAHLSNESAAAADVGTVSGGIAERTTHRYHVYQPGFGQLVQMTVVSGDSGKANVRRRWGYFDDDDGVFFELDGTTLYAVVRTSTSGSPVDTRIAQANWNGDVLDGSGDNVSNLTGVNLDVASLNIYWIDFQWLGAGRIRFGIVSPAGERITAHSVENANSSTTPWAKTPTLPIRWGIENTGVAASPSRLKMVCAQVAVEGPLIPDLQRRSIKWESPAATTTTTTEAHVISFRSKATLNSITNRKTTLGEKFTVYVKTNPCRIRIYQNATINTPTWTSVRSDAAAEYDTAATVSGGTQLISWVLDTGCHDVDLPPNFGLLGLALRLSADGSQDQTFTITAESLEGSNTVVELTATGIDI